MTKKQKIAALNRLSDDELIALYYAAKEKRAAYSWHEYERNIFAACKESRPCRRKVSNRFSREEAGVHGEHISFVRTGRNSGVVCRSRNIY